MHRIVYLILPFLMLSCLNKDKPAPVQNQVEQTIHIEMIQEPVILDWNLSSNHSSTLIIDQLMEGLTRYRFTGKKIEIQPALAETWTASDNNRTFTFTLKKNIAWTDGTRLTAHHFSDSWKRILTLAGPAKFFFFDIKNAKKFSTGVIRDFKHVGIRVLDTHTLRVHLTKPVPYWPAIPSLPASYPVRRDLIKKHGQTSWYKGKHLVTLGPFKLLDFEPEKKIVLIRNDHYHLKKTLPRKLVALYPANKTVAKKLFTQNTLDLLQNLDSSDMTDEIIRNSTTLGHYIGTRFLAFNTRSNPLKHPSLRKAIALAIDREEILRITDTPSLSPSSSLIPPGLPAYKPYRPGLFNPAQAKRILKEIKPHFLKKHTITLHASKSSINRLVTENIRAQLIKNLGLKIKIRLHNRPVDMNTPMDILLTGDVEKIPDTGFILGTFHSGSRRNSLKWTNTSFDKFLDMASASSSPETRHNLYEQALQILQHDSMAVLPLYFISERFAISKRISHLSPNKLRRWNFTRSRKN